MVTSIGGLLQTWAGTRVPAPGKGGKAAAVVGLEGLQGRLWARASRILSKRLWPIRGQDGLSLGGR